MNEHLSKVLINGLHGKNTHINPKKAIEGLNPDNARKNPGASDHSCWELIHHILVWQEGIIGAIKGEKVDWQDISKNHNWPSTDYLSDDTNFSNLVEKFLQGLTEAEELASLTDLNKPMPAWDGAPIIQAFMVLLQHNSYHIGQIITTRKILGLWDK